MTQLCSCSLPGISFHAFNSMTFLSLWRWSCKWGRQSTLILFHCCIVAWVSTSKWLLLRFVELTSLMVQSTRLEWNCNPIITASHNELLIYFFRRSFVDSVIGWWCTISRYLVLQFEFRDKKVEENLLIVISWHHCKPYIIHMGY